MSKELDMPDSSRAQRIAGLRALADLAERIPELPLPEQISLCVTDGNDDEAANKALDAIEAALNSDGVEFVREHDHISRFVDIPYPALRFHVFWVPAEVMVRYHAQRSYATNVQVDEPAGAVA